MKNNLPKLNIIPTEYDLHTTFCMEVIDQDESGWWFLDYGDGGINLNHRWVIVHRHRDDWWGVRAAWDDTHESAIDGITIEMMLAKKAIKILKRQLKQSAKEVSN